MSSTQSPESKDGPPNLGVLTIEAWRGANQDLTWSPRGSIVMTEHQMVRSDPRAEPRQQFRGRKSTSQGYCWYRQNSFPQILIRTYYVLASLLETPGSTMLAFKVLTVWWERQINK